MEALLRLRIWRTWDTGAHQLLECCLRVSHIIIFYRNEICLWCRFCLHTLKNQIMQYNNNNFAKGVTCVKYKLIKKLSKSKYRWLNTAH